jgi:exonuclease III
MSWKVCGQLAALAQRQIEAVLERGPDVVALQEVSAGNYADWCEGLMGAGYSIVSAIDLTALPYPLTVPPIRRRYFNLTAARAPLAPLAGIKFEGPEKATAAFPEKYLAASVLADGQAIEVHNADVPPSETLGLIKVHTLQAIRKRVDAAPEGPLLLCGDFMTPRSENDRGMTTWAAGHSTFSEEWEAAERSILEHPFLRDVYLEGREPGTRFAVSKRTRGTPHRYDHIFASPALRTVSCAYLEDWMSRKLSDHAPVEAELVPVS